MKFAVLLVACFAGVAYGQTAAPASDSGNANTFVDQIVTALKTKEGFDPLHVPDHEFDINQKLGIIPIKGKAKVSNLLITGLSHIQRIGDAKLENKDGAFAAKLHLGDSNVKVHADLHLDLGNIIHPNLKVDADIGDIAVLFSVTIGADGKPAIQEFDVDEFKHVKFHVHGLAILDPLVDLIADAFVSIANTQARHLITGLVRPVLEEELKTFKLGA